MPASPRHRVVITGTGLISPCGIGTPASWDAIRNGRSGIGPITLFDASRHAVRFAGEVKGFDPLTFMDRREARRLDRHQAFAMAAAELAVQDAGWTPGTTAPERTAALIGTSVGGLASVEEQMLAGHRGEDPSRVSPLFILQLTPNLAASHVAIRFNCRGAAWGPNSACATSAHAIGEATELIRAGQMDLVLAGGTETPISYMGVAGFAAMRALSTRNDAPTAASRPFDIDRDGFVLAEGAAVLVLESLEHATARGATILGEVVGYGQSSDAFHVTAPSPEHEGAQRCMRAAIGDAGLRPADIQYVNAHGTSTPLGDPAEAHAIGAVFDAHAAQLPVSSTKSMTGHMIGASGAAEAIFTLMALREGVLPPTINLERQDPTIELDCIPQAARPAAITRAMSNSFGFGGTNVSLILARPEVGQS